MDVSQHFWCDDCRTNALHQLDKKRPDADSWSWACLECGAVRVVRRVEDEVRKQEDAKARLWEITAGIAFEIGEEIDTVIRRVHEHYVREGHPEDLGTKEALIAIRAEMVRWYGMAQASRGLYFKQGYFHELTGEE
jgi:hypothetical protein